MGKKAGLLGFEPGCWGLELLRAHHKIKHLILFELGAYFISLDFNPP
jgi:hypothetical protein